MKPKLNYYPIFYVKQDKPIFLLKTKESRPLFFLWTPIFFYET